MKLRSRDVNPYGMAVTVITIAIGTVGFLTGSFLLIYAFLGITTIIFWILVSLAVGAFFKVRKRRNPGATRD